MKCRIALKRGKDENIIKREKEIDSNIRSLNKELEKIADKLKSLYETKLISVLGSDSEKTAKRVNKLIDELKKQSQKTEIDISVLSNSISDLKDKRNNINKDIQSKENILEDINTDLSLNELKKLLSEHKERFSYLDKIISKLDTLSPSYFDEISIYKGMNIFKILDKVFASNRTFLTSIIRYSLAIIRY